MEQKASWVSIPFLCSGLRFHDSQSLLCLHKLLLGSLCRKGSLLPAVPARPGPEVPSQEEFLSAIGTRGGVERYRARIWAAGTFPKDQFENYPRAGKRTESRFSLSIKGDIMSLFLCEEKIKSSLTKYVKIGTSGKIKNR